MNLAFGCPLEHVHLARIGWGSCLEFGSLRVQNAAAHGGWKNLSQLLPLKNWCVAFGAKKADASQLGKQSESQLFWASSPSGDTARKQTFHGTVFDLPTWRHSGSWWNEPEIHHDCGDSSNIIKLNISRMDMFELCYGYLWIEIHNISMTYP